MIMQSRVVPIKQGRGRNCTDSRGVCPRHSTPGDGPGSSGTLGTRSTESRVEGRTLHLDGKRLRYSTREVWGAPCKIDDGRSVGN